MPKKRGETAEQHMDRLRAIRGLPPQRHEIMDRTRAAVCYLNATNDGGDGHAAIYAFMSIFHPDVPTETVRQMAQDRRR